MVSVFGGSGFAGMAEGLASLTSPSSSSPGTAVIDVLFIIRKNIEMIDDLNDTHEVGC